MMLTYVLVLASTVALSSGQVNDGACLRFQGSACCPMLTPFDRDIEEAVDNVPIYVSFLPKNEDNVKIDNICYTAFPVPDSPNVFITYFSRVYSDGQNQVRSFMVSQPEKGVGRLGNGLCNFISTILGVVEDCQMRISHRCLINGDCPVVEGLDSVSGIIGSSDTRKPISHSCLSRVSTVARLHGLPSEEYYILPMRLPSRCVLNQVCSVLPTVQRFCQTVGVAFPKLNCEQTFF